MASGRSQWWQGLLPSIWRSPITGDAVDHRVGGLETRRDLVAAGLAQHDPGDRRAVLAEPQRVVTEHEIGRHHLRYAGDRSRVLVRAGLDLRLSCLDGGLAMCRPHRAGYGFAKRTTALTARDVGGC